MDRPAAGPHELEALLARAPRVRALARGLCADAAAAEDLAQDALVVALEHPGAASAPLAWFRRVLERLAIDRARSQVARHGRERRVARGEAQPSTHDLVARAELQRRLVEEVLALPEPYRETLLERWFEERTPEQIARRLGVNASTVRTRLARGHALLRERLERREGRNWLPALAALGRSREVAETSIGTGGLLVATGTKLALFGVVLALGALWMAWPTRGAAPESAARPAIAAEAPATEVASATAPQAVGRTEIELPETLSVASEADAGDAPPDGELSESEAAAMELADGLVEAGVLRGLVVRGRTPVSSGTAWLCPGIREAPHDPRDPWPGIHNPVPTPDGVDPRSAPIGPDGRFRFEGVRGAWHTLAIDTGAGIERQMTFDGRGGSDHSRTVVVNLGSASIAGHVYDAFGAPIAGARVATFKNLSRNGEGRSFKSSAVTDAWGAYAMRDLPAGTWPVQLYLQAESRDPDEFAEVDLELGETARLDFGRPQPLPVWSGVLRARSGDPVRRKALRLVETGNGRRRDHFLADGTIWIPLEPGTYRVTTPRIGAMLEVTELASVTIDETGLVQDLELPGTRLRGLALDASTGEPWSRPLDQGLSIQPRGHDYPAAFTHLVLESDGSFVVDGLWPGEWVLGGWPFSARLPGGAEAVLTILEGDVEVPVTVEFAPPR